MSFEEIPNKQYSEYIALSRYARWIPEENRRETWEETVERYISFFKDRFGKELSQGIDEALAHYNLPPDHGDTVDWSLEQALRGSISNLETMPSMRLLMTAGPAVEKDNVAAYNCAFLSISRQRAFDELLYILTCGTGVGFSVEEQHINKLPTIAEEFYESDTTIVVGDSKIGWATSFRELISLLYSGKIPKWNTSKVRSKGELLKTFGGRACLTGDTIVYKDRKKSRDENEITIKQLFDIQERELNGKYRGRFKKIKLRSLDENTGTFYRNNLISVVDNGIAPIYLVKTKSGYEIKATSNHRFMSDTGDYKELSDFVEGEDIAVNGSREPKTSMCIDCWEPISRRAMRCRSCADINQQKEDPLYNTARQRKACRKAFKTFCEECGVTDKRLEIHHKDKDPTNNDSDNLVCLCCKCHSRHHAKENSYSDPYSHKYVSYDQIESISYLGEEQVYDLQMEGPNHNFIANGFISHNSGPEPLNELFKFCVNTFRRFAGKKLPTIAVFDICCKVAEIIVVGGVRRSALISLSGLNDKLMQRAKSPYDVKEYTLLKQNEDGTREYSVIVDDYPYGERSLILVLNDWESGELQSKHKLAWWHIHPERSLCNNSAVYLEKPDVKTFLKEFLSLYESYSGERGIFNREATYKKVRESGRRGTEDNMGTNPCCEIILRDGQFCNLSEVVVRSGDSIDDLKRKVEIATILGTLQATITDFRYLSHRWKKNTEEEALLGVSLTGIMDHPVLSGSVQNLGGEGPATLSEILMELKSVAIETNDRWAKLLGIAPAASITCVKPSGTVSQLVNSSSGIHTRFSPYYIRRVRGDTKDPVSTLLKEVGVPTEKDIMSPNDVSVFSFAIESPSTSVFRSQVSAIDQLNLWSKYYHNWCEHKPSMTVYVKEEEWVDVAAWVFQNFDYLSGISFLPYDGGMYQQAPYEEITKEKYDELLKEMPKDIDWKKLQEYEKIDNTTSSHELACTGNSCEII